MIPCHRAYHNRLSLTAFGVCGNDVVVERCRFHYEKSYPRQSLLLGDFTLSDEQAGLINEFPFPQ